MVWCIAIGYIGPKTIPIMVTEMTAAIKEGTSQTISWKLLRVIVLNQSFRINYTRGGGKGLQHRDEDINIDRFNGSKLYWPLDSLTIVEYEINITLSVIGNKIIRPNVRPGLKNR